jgi:hypothetical protein
MQSERPENLNTFDHLHIKTEGRLLIQSTCKGCGKSRIVSKHDGSLEQWEDGHRCEPNQAKAS